jgi:transglutaminase-like putative cysteine protease
MDPSDLSKYLGSSKYIDTTHADIVKRAANLAIDTNNTVELIDNCFRYVRDQINHSLDFELNPVTVIASDVLLHTTGYCYAKRHLLAALLRANQVPTGVCYQRLSIDGEAAPFCLHGLNAVYLQSTGWFCLDPRGNKKGVDAKFNPPTETLAFPIVVNGEDDIPFIYAEPLTLVTDGLEKCDTFDQMADSLPDLDTQDFPEADYFIKT